MLLFWKVWGIFIRKLILIIRYLIRVFSRYQTSKSLIYKWQAVEARRSAINPARQNGRLHSVSKSFDFPKYLLCKCYVNGGRQHSHSLSNYSWIDWPVETIYKYLCEKKCRLREEGTPKFTAAVVCAYFVRRKTHHHKRFVLHQLLV